MRTPDTSAAGPRVLLVGLMATGKSTLGRAISERTGWPAYDNDELLQQQTGATAAELLLSSGEPAMRAAESAVLAYTLALPAPLVAGVAAGTVLDPADRQRLRDGGHVVWLRTPVATLVGRVTGDSHRPFLTEDPAGALREMADHRHPLYAEVAHQVLDMDELSVPEAAALVLEAVAGSTTRGSR